ncbi:hypothetical protein QE152_g16074 [Popillia japonica]|uniref:Uncharacterized protein n=1 Tax=Popillia japonica TaxID=7064 RepID=A0AAW1L6L6_POPJA
MLAWLCKKLEEITFIGYKYPEENLVAIARLRKNTLKKLEFAHDDVMYSDFFNINAKKEISEIFGKAWSPTPSSQLHPVILDPLSGDSDEYIAPYLLADIR